MSKPRVVYWSGTQPTSTFTPDGTVHSRGVESIKDELQRLLHETLPLPCEGQRVYISIHPELHRAWLRSVDGMDYETFGLTEWRGIPVKVLPPPKKGQDPPIVAQLVIDDNGWLTVENVTLDRED